MISRDALEYVANLGKTQQYGIEGRIYTNEKLYLVKEPKPCALELNNLSSLVDYLKANTDNIDLKEYMIQIVNPTEVALVSKLTNDADRHCLVEVKPLLSRLYFDEYLDAEDFNIMLQSKFADNEDKALLLQFSSNVVEQTTTKTTDDGTTQVVQAKTGVATVKNVTVPNPAVLAPYRTFQEVEQVESKFVFRAKEGPRFKLIEADGGAWKNEAMSRIKEYLRKELGEEIVILA